MNKKIVIAAGHYPEKPGCWYFGLSEHAEAVKVVARLARKLIVMGFEPLIVEGDLVRKARLANEAAPLCALDVHFNAAPGHAEAVNSKQGHAEAVNSKQPGGCETLFGSNPLDRTLAEFIQASLVTMLGNRDRGVKFDDYAGTPELDECYFTREINCPAVIVEPLFLSNPTEAQRLQGDYPDHGFIAMAIANGIKDFADHLERMEAESKVEVV